MTDEYVPLRRAPLDPDLLGQRLSERGFTGKMPRYSRVTSSTQVDVRRLLEIGERPPFAVIADEQTAGRGRLDRTWQAPQASSVLLSVAMPSPTVTIPIPLAAGVTAVDALRAIEPSLQLKWPNDIVITIDGGLRKLGGMIAEVVDGVVVLGIGINVELAPAELPTPQAISFRQLSATVERESVLADLITAFDAWTPPTIDEYRALCCTLGASVRVECIDGVHLVGQAIDVATTGALIVRTEDGPVTISAGDVHHVRSL